MERHTTFVEGFANNDFFEGAAVGQVGDADGFHAGVLVRFPLPASTDLAPEANDEEYLLFGNGDFTPGNLQGWSISAQQGSPEEWFIRLSLVLDDGTPTIRFLDWELESEQIVLCERSLFIEVFWDPTVSGNPLYGMFINGLPLASNTKAATMVPSTVAPRIGGGPQPAPLVPPAGVQVEPRLSIAGVCYRAGASSFTLDNEPALVFERVQEVDDITQLPEPGAVQWDNIWSARRGLPSITGQGQIWSDLSGDVDFVRTGSGDSLKVAAAKAHWWNQ